MFIRPIFMGLHLRQIQKSAGSGDGACCNVPVGHIEGRCRLPKLPAGKEIQQGVGALQVVKLVDAFLQQQCNPVSKWHSL